MNKKKLVIIAASLLMLGAVTVKPAMAYFTDTHQANGQVQFSHIEITPYEEVYGLTKKITIENTGKEAVYARIKVFAGDTHPLTFQGADWNEKNDYYEYDKVLQVGDTSEPILVTIDPAIEDAEEFNVIVVEEACGLDKDGNPTWDKKYKNQEYFKASNYKAAEDGSGDAIYTQPSSNEGGVN